MNRRNLILVGVLAVLVAALLAWALIPAPVVVEMSVVTRGPFEQTVDEQAKTRIRDHYVDLLAARGGTRPDCLARGR